MHMGSQPPPLEAQIAEALGICVGSEMARYLMRCAQRPDGGLVALIGEDARTGVPKRIMIDPDTLRRMARVEPSGAASA